MHGLMTHKHQVNHGLEEHPPKSLSQSEEIYRFLIVAFLDPEIHLLNFPHPQCNKS